MGAPTESLRALLSGALARPAEVLAQVLAQVLAGGVPPGFVEWAAQNAKHTQAFTTLVLFGSFLAFRYYVPRNDPEFWGARTTRVTVTAMGVGGAVSLGVWLADWLLAATAFYPAVALLTPHLNHLTGALIMPFLSVSLARALPTLQDDSRPAMYRLRTVLEARPVWAAMLVGSAVSTALVALALAGGVAIDPLNLRGDDSPAANLYRLAINAPVALYAALLCAATFDAHRRGAGGPGLARRWRFISLALFGFLMLEGELFLMPLLATAAPAAFPPELAGSTTRLLEIPAFAVIGTGACLAFARPPERSEADVLWGRYELYRRLLEDLEARVSGFGAGTQMLTPHWHNETRTLRRLLADPELDAPEFAERATVAYALLAIAARPDDEPLRGRAPGAALLAVERLNAEFAAHPPGTEPRQRAEGDLVAPVAGHVRLLLDRRNPARLVSQPDWLQAVALVAAGAGLLAPEQEPEKLLDARAHRVCGRVHNARRGVLRRPRAA